MVVKFKKTTVLLEISLGIAWIAYLWISKVSGSSVEFVLTGAVGMSILMQRVLKLYKVEWILQGFVLRNILSLVESADFRRPFEDSLGLAVLTGIGLLNVFPLLSSHYLNISCNPFYYQEFPAPLSLCSITIFLSVFKIGLFSTNFTGIVVALCYALLTLNIFNNWTKIGKFDFFDKYFIIVNLINLALLVVILLYPSIPVEKSTVSALGCTLLFNRHPTNSGGIQGFLNKHVFLNELGVIADQFLEVCPETAALLDCSHKHKLILVNDKTAAAIYPHLVK